MKTGSPAREGALAVGLALALIACGGSSKPGAERPEATAPSDGAAAVEASGAAAMRADLRSPPAATPASSAAAAPDGYVEMRALGILVIDGGHTLGLVDAEQTVIVPISIGGTEALSISLRLDDESFTRPLTHDLLDAVLDTLGGEIHHVQIDRLEQGVFFASVHLQHGNQVVELDARSSDAVALAVGDAAPIFVATDVVDRAGLSRDELERRSPPGRRLPPPAEDDDDDDDRGRDDDTIDARVVPPPS